MKRIVLCAACALLLLFFNGQMQAQVKGNPALPPVTPQPAIQKHDTKISPALQRLYNNSIAERMAATSGNKPVIVTDAMDKYLQVKQGRVVIDITVKESMALTEKNLQQAGFITTGVYGRVISGTLPVTALPKLEAISTIRYARPAYRPMHQFKNSVAMPMPCNTSWYDGLPVRVISQGDTAQRSYLARKKYNVTGKGVKLGILSDSYNNLGTADIGVMRGELPGPGNPFNFKKPVQVLQDVADSTGTDEGRAMAEIVHDVAPGAELYFHTAFLGTANFAQGIQDLANKGCRVITDDIFYYEEPFFQDGIIAQSVDLAKKKGVTYFSSAGNQSNNSYESDYRGSTEEVLGIGNGTAHNFNAPGDFPRFFQPVFIPPGGTLVASFQWDQPSFSAGGAGASSDLDIYLIDGTGNIVAGGAANNISSGDPIEVFGFDNHTPDNTFFLVILKAAGPDPSHLKYNLYNDAQFFITTPVIPGLFAPTLVGHAKAAGAIATGAAFFANTPAYGTDTPKVEGFSSLGGVANYFDAAGNRIPVSVRLKPEIVAPDGANTSFFQPFGNGDVLQDADTAPNFFGTSAAAPHAAAVAALMIEAERLNNLTPAQIKGVLTASTIDMDNIYTPGFDKGFDFNTGYGLIKADEAVGNVKFPNLYLRDLSLKAVCSDNPSVSSNWKINNPNNFEVSVHWFMLGSNQQQTLLVPPGETSFISNAIYYGRFQLPGIVIITWDDNFGFTRLDIASSSRTACNATAGRVMDAVPEELMSRPMLADVYPNPAGSSFRVYLSLAEQPTVSLQLFSIDGKKLLEKQTSQSRGVVSIDATSLRPGIYLLNIKQGAFNKTIKLIKQ